MPQNKENLYESQISTKRWIVYDILGNIGWIVYCVCSWKRLRSGLTAYSIVLALPAVLMLVGIGELISERVAGLSFVLPKVRLYRGFGALTLGGVCGTVVSAAALCMGQTAQLGWMLGGGVLCSAAGWLLFREYRPMK